MTQLQEILRRRIAPTVRKEDAFGRREVSSSEIGAYLELQDALVCIEDYETRFDEMQRRGVDAMSFYRDNCPDELHQAISIVLAAFPPSKKDKWSKGDPSSHSSSKAEKTIANAMRWARNMGIIGDDLYEDENEELHAHELDPRQNKELAKVYERTSAIEEEREIGGTRHGNNGRKNGQIRSHKQQVVYSASGRR